MKGRPLSSGRATGPLAHLTSHTPQGPALSIHPSKVEQEIARYRLALSTSKRDLQSLQNKLCDGESEEVVEIIDAHIQMLEDPFITVDMEGKIREMLLNTETVFRGAIGKYEEQFVKRADSFFKERLLDVRDVSKRILSHLDGAEGATPPEERCVIYAEELGPSDIIDLSSCAIAFVTKKGGMSSHSALIARARGIPYVADLDLSEIAAGTSILVDGGSGEVTLNPDEEMLAQLASEQAPIAYPADMKLQVNINDLSDFEHLPPDYAVGLFRTEISYLGRDIFLISEDEQYTLYRRIVEQAEGRLVTFRLFDVGGDKMGPKEEINPLLGVRGIRFLLHNLDVFRRQARAILRVSHFGPVRVLIPMVSDPREIEATKELFCECQSEVGGAVSIGAMIEVPAAAILADQIAQSSDFLAIGTNDLAQYTLAAHRDAHDYYDQMHPSVLKLIELIVDLAGDTPVTLCGELAVRAEAIPVLHKMGIRALSVPARQVPLYRERGCKTIK